MAPIVYVVIAGFIYMAGQVTAPKPKVVLMKDGKVVETRQVAEPVLVVVDKENVEVREVKKNVFNRLPIKSTPGMTPFYRNGFGELTVACQADCHEEGSK